MSATNENKTNKITHLFITDAPCLLREIKVLPQGTVVANISIFNGSDAEKQQQFLNGSFVLPERYSHLAKEYSNTFVKCDITDLSCEFNDGYYNYRGFINRMSF